MYAKLCIVLLLAVGLSQAEIRYLPDGGLLQFMMQSRDLSQGNPECFAYYVPVLNNIVNQYQKDYEQCLGIAQDSRDSIDDKTAPNRTEIDQSANDACQIMQVCSAEKSAIEYFDCYVNAGSDNAKSMYTISANSAELLAEVKEDYRLIQIDEFACTNKSERAYVENTAATYEELDKCLRGLSPVPTGTPSPPETSTKVPDSTTGVPDPTTAAPDSSSSPPESSTQTPEPTSGAPESTTAAPDSSSSPPESSTQTPEPTSGAPESTTAAPDSSSSQPESSTQTPEPTSGAPDSTTPAPDSSSIPPESSTETPEPTSGVPESSTAAPDSTSIPPESSSEPSSNEPESSTGVPESTSRGPSTDDDVIESTTDSNRNQYPEEDLPLPSTDIKSIIDNLKNWLKRH